MRNVLEADYSGNVLIISIYNISKRKLTLSTGLRKIIVRQEKARAIGLKGASSRALDP